MRRREAALLAVALGVLAVAWAMTAYPSLSGARDTLLSIVAFMFLILPGFVVAQLLRNEDQHADAVALLSAGTIALGFVALGGLLLDLLPFGGITGTTWLALIGALIVTASALRPRVERARAGARERAAAVADAAAEGVEPPAREPSRLAPVALLVASAVAVSFVALGNGQPTPGALAVWFCAVCPGIAVYRLIGQPSAPGSLLLSLGISVAISGAVAAVLFAAHVFTIALLLQVVVGLTVAALIADPWLYSTRWEPSYDRMGIDSVIVLLASLLGVLVGYAYAFLLPVISVVILGLAIAALARWLETASGGAVMLAVSLGAAALPGLLARVGFESGGEITVVVTGYALIAIATIRYFRGGGLGSQLVVGVLALLFAAAIAYLGGASRIPSVAAAALPLLAGLGLAILPMADRRADTGGPRLPCS